MYKCSSCSYSSATKLGKCPDCGLFGSFIEDMTSAKSTKKSKKTFLGKGKQLSKDSNIKIDFLKISNQELLRLFSRGIKKSGVYLIGGEPGIGKSTIILQILDDIIQNNQNIQVGYFSGEESPDQISDRIKRLNLKIEKKIDIFHSTQIDDIMTTTEINKYDLIIVDSIQTVYYGNVDSPAGSPNQVKFCSEKISEFAKNCGITSFIVGHVTKGGEIAGPKYLEHIVDVVIYLEGDRFGQYRFLRCKKNRFDNTDDVAIYEMTLFGLQPVYDLKDRIINSANTSNPGNVITIGIDNGRPVIVNLEVLINKCKGKYPQRTAVGIDPQRLNLIIAILERYLKINLGFFDVYVNIPGEFKFYDSGLDLAIAAAVTSQFKNKIIDKKNVFIGELGLGGQVLKSKLHEKRKKELPKGFNIVDFKGIKNIVELINIM